MESVAPPGDGLFDPVIRRLEAPVIGLQRRWDRLRGKRQQGASLAGAVVATASIKARARIVSGPIPETADAREAIRTLDRRVRALETVVADTQEGFDDKLEDVQREVVDLRTDLADAKIELSERIVW